MTIDTVRADRVGCYGASGAETPNLERMPRQKVLRELWSQLDGIQDSNPAQ